MGKARASMRILYVIPELSTGGSERQLLLLAGEMVALGHTVRIVALRAPRRPIPLDGVLDIQTLDGVRSQSPRCLSLYWHTIHAFRPDVLHTCLFGFDFWANVVGKLLRVPCIISSRRQLATWRKRRHVWWQNAGNLFVDAVVANSQAGAEYCDAHERFLNRGQIYSVPNAYASRAVGQDVETDPLPVANGRVVTYVANFWAGKRHDLLVEAVAALPPAEGVELWLVGEGECQEAVRQQVAALGLSDRVHFLGRRHDVLGILEKSQLYVHPSDGESSPNAVLEAMAAGVPIVAMASGGVPELLQGGEAGVLVPVGEVGALVAAIRHVLGQGQEAAVRSQTARTAVVATHAPAQVARRYSDIYACIHKGDAESVGVYLLGDRNLPSSWFRIYQWVPTLQAAGATLRLYTLPRIRGGRVGQFVGCLWQGVVRLWQLRNAKRHDRLWVQKGLSPVRMRGAVSRLQAAGRRVIYDIDDSVHTLMPIELPRPLRWLQHPDEPIDLLRMASSVLAGNSHLVDAAESENDHVALLPTVVDTNRYWYSPVRPEQEIPVIGWAGSRSTNRYVNMLAPVLKRLAQEHAFVFRIVSSDMQGIDRESFEGVEIDFRPWSRETEIVDLRTFTIGVMPLPDTEWEQGKCGLKALTYMALGIPAVCSPAGVSREIMEGSACGLLAGSAETWYVVLGELLRSEERRSRLAAAARESILARYSLSTYRLMVSRRVTQGAEILRARSEAE